jgi:hypothetical protein
MKKSVFSLILFSMAFLASGREPVAGLDRITWFGLDYSYVKFIGSPDDFRDIPKIRSYYFNDWNYLVIAESSKYDIRGAFDAQEVTYALETAVQRSESRSMEGIVSSGNYELGKTELAEVLKSYVDPSMPGTGALFVMETLNKFAKNAVMWVAVFEISTGEIHHLKRYTGKSGGFGFRNYWARPYYNVITTLKSNPRKPY